MANKQLVEPNRAAVGTIAYCLQYSDRVAGLSGGEDTAWIAWQNVQYPRTDALPTDVAVPCWFSYYLNGFNLGHVVWWIPGEGFYSSPWRSGTTHAVLSSIAEVEQIYGCSFVGWSEDISGLRVVTISEGENDVINSNDDVDKLYLVGLHRYPESDAVRAGYFGMTWQAAIDSIRSSEEYLTQNDALLVQLPKLTQQAASKTVTKQDVLDYLNGNLK